MEEGSPELLKQTQQSTKASSDKYLANNNKKDFRYGGVSSPEVKYSSGMNGEYNSRRSSGQSSNSVKKSSIKGSDLQDLILNKSSKSKQKHADEMKVSQSTTFSKNSKKLSNRNQSRLENIKINLTGCKYDVVKRVACDKNFGYCWKLDIPVEEATNQNSNNWDVYWCDGGINMRFFQQMKLYQVCNHLPGMNLITRKDTLTQSIK